MSVIIFIVILAILVFVHELGHFVAAKATGMRVDEFGLGFPPRLIKIKKGETVYSLNAIPFGGFVKIHGEDPNQESLFGEDSSRSFTAKPKWAQVLVLAAGVTCNVIFAWLIISAGFMIGLPAAVDAYPKEIVKDAKVTITQVESDSPAFHAGIKSGDTIEKIEAGNDSIVISTPGDVQDFIAAHAAESVALTIHRGRETKAISVQAKEGIVADRPVVGIAMSSIGTVRLPFHKALYQGFFLTASLAKETTLGLFSFFGSLFQGKATLSQVSGPVGIAGLVGDARALGFIYLLSFTAIISLNLAVINLIPFPALDGGRILFVFIEAIKGSPIKPKIANSFNAVGFLLLITLMLAITYHDILKLFA